jgi:hypothetical protein
MPRRRLSKAVKNNIAKRQNFKCANVDGKVVKNAFNECLLHKYEDGSFNASGFDIDHIIDLCLGGPDIEFNLQALCKMCHGHKTLSVSTLSHKIKAKIKRKVSKARRKPDFNPTTYNIWDGIDDDDSGSDSGSDSDYKDESEYDDDSDYDDDDDETDYESKSSSSIIKKCSFNSDKYNKPFFKTSINVKLINYMRLLLIKHKYFRSRHTQSMSRSRIVSLYNKKYNKSSRIVRTSRI